MAENNKKIPGKRIPGTVKFLACRFQPRKGQAMRLNRGLRYQIKALLDAGHSQKTVASQPGISPGGLSRELKRNGGREKYDPDRADRRAERLQREAHVHYRYGDRIWAETVAMIREDLSPEQVAGRRGLEGKASPSVPTIYRHVKGVAGLGPHLRHGGKPYRKRGPLKDRRGSIAGRIPIALRPAAADMKNRFGDFEIDLINGASHGQHLHRERQAVQLLHPGTARHEGCRRPGRYRDCGVRALQGIPAHDYVRQRKGVCLARKDGEGTGSRVLFRKALPLVGTRSEREHERSDTAVPAEGNVLWGPDQGTGEADRVETEQQAEKETWISDSAGVYFYTS